MLFPSTIKPAAESIKRDDEEEEVGEEKRVYTKMANKAEKVSNK